MSVAGSIIRFTNFGLRLLQVCASIIMLGIFGYFLATQSEHDLEMKPWVKAVTGISGAATFYTFIASCTTLFIGGVPFFSGLAIGLDVLFASGSIAIAIMCRHGASACTGRVDTPLGIGDAEDPAKGFGEGGFGAGDGKKVTYVPDLKSACKLQKAVFAISLISIFLFIATIPAQRGYTKHRHDAKRASTSTKDSSGRAGGIRRFWPWAKPPAPGPRTTRVNYDMPQSPTTTIPLDDHPQEDTPPRYASLFGRMKTRDRDSKLKEPQPTVNPDFSKETDPSSDRTYMHSNSTHPYPTSPFNTDLENRDPWYGNDYNYGQSGVGSGGYAYGYGDAGNR